MRNQTTPYIGMDAHVEATVAESAQAQVETFHLHRAKGPKPVLIKHFGFLDSRFWRINKYALPTVSDAQR